MMDTQVDRELLEKIADLVGKPVGAFNIRKDTGCDGRQSTEHIEITGKTDGKSGIDIRVKDGTVGETCHIPVIITKPGIQELVYNDFYIGENCNVNIVAGCGIHNCSDCDSQHDGIHTFYVGKNAKVTYIEKHYGEGDGSEFAETSSGYVDCASVRACYPSSKRAAETLCMAYGAEYGADVVIARLSHTYGPGFTESDNRVYAQFIRNVLRGEDIVLKSRGEAFRSWLYVVDAAHAILRLLLDGERANAYNVAHSESNISIRELAELIARKADRKVVFDIAEDDVMKGNTTPVTKATFNTDKLKALGWKPLWDVESGFGHTIEVSFAQKL